MGTYPTDALVQRILVFRFLAVMAREIQQTDK